MKAIPSLILMVGLQACAAHRVDTAQQPPDCLRETGSRIERKSGECVPANGRSYTREELQRTGYGSTADALRKSMP